MATPLEVVFTGLIAMVHPAGWSPGTPAEHFSAILLDTSYSNQFSKPVGQQRQLEKHHPRMTVPIRLGTMNNAAVTASWDDNFPPLEIVTIPGSEVQYATWDLSGKSVSIEGASGAMSTTGLDKLLSLSHIQSGWSDKVFGGYSQAVPAPQPGERATPVNAVVHINGGTLTTSDRNKFEVRAADDTPVIKGEPMATAVAWSMNVEEPVIHVRSLDGSQPFDIKFSGGGQDIRIAIYNVCHCNVPESSGTLHHVRAIYDLLPKEDRPAQALRLVPDQNFIVTMPGPLTRCSPIALFSE